MPDHLTERRAKTLHFIGAFIDKLGYAPTFAEMAAHMGSHKPAVFEHVEGLIQIGCLRKTADRARSLELTALGKAWYDARDWHPNVSITFAESITQHAAPGVE